MEKKTIIIICSLVIIVAIIVVIKFKTTEKIDKNTEDMRKNNPLLDTEAPVAGQGSTGINNK